MLGYKGSPTKLMIPKVNAKYAALYLKWQFDRYQNWCKAVASYNAGRYNPSKFNKRIPRNIRYVINVQKKLNKRFKKALSCDTMTLRGLNVTNNDVPRR